MIGHVKYFSHILTKNVRANLKWLLRNMDTLWFCKISFYFTSPFYSYIRSIVSQLRNSTVKKNEEKKWKKSKQAEWRCWNQPHHNRKKPRTQSIRNKLCSIHGSVVYLKLLWSTNIALLLQKKWVHFSFHCYHYYWWFYFNMPTADWSQSQLRIVPHKN